jgi:hypothetical protein
MKKMDIRKITAMTAALVMTISMASCGRTNTSSTKGAKGGRATGTSKSTTSDETAETTTAPAAARGETSDEAVYESEMKAEAKDAGADFGLTDMATEAEGIADDVASPTADKDTDTAPEDREPVNSGKAFVLTAGEWNDNNNWGFFTNLVKNETISFPVFGFDPTHRIAVTVTKDGEPAREQPVELLDADGNVICPDPTTVEFVDKNTGEARTFQEISELKNRSVAYACSRLDLHDLFNSVSGGSHECFVIKSHFAAFELIIVQTHGVLHNFIVSSHNGSIIFSQCHYFSPPNRISLSCVSI